MAENKEYYAFISYKREDEKWAKWLQDKLEHYRFPTNLNGRTDLPKNIRPTFRDVTDLKPGLLAEEINNALHNSQWLIVVCSPRAAKSPWVCKEAQTFINLGRADHIIPFVIEGNPFSNDTATECYPDSIRNLTGRKELLAANINEMGRDAAVIKVVARMFNLRFDTLWQRHEREKRRRRNWIFAILSLFVLAVIAVATHIWNQNINLKRAISRAAAEKSTQLLDQNDSYLACRIAIDALNTAYTPEAEASLRYAFEKKTMVLRCGYGRNNHLSTVSDPEMNYIVSTSDSTVAIWDFHSGKQIKKMYGHTGNVIDIDISPNGKWAISASSDKTVRIWDISTSNCVDTLVGHKGAVRSVVFSPTGKYAASESVDSTIRIWNLHTKRCETIIKMPSVIFKSVSFSPDGKKLVAASNAKRKYIVSEWDVSTGQCIRELYGHTWIVSSAKYSPDGKNIVSGSYDGYIRIWDVEQGKCIDSLYEDRWVHDVAYSKDGRYIISAIQKNIHIWEAATGYPLQYLYGHTNNITSVAVCEDENVFVSSAIDNTIRVWELPNSSRKYSKYENGPLKISNHDSVLFLPTKKRYSIINDQLMDLSNWRPIEDIPFCQGELVPRVDYCPKKGIIILCKNDSIFEWSTKNRKLVLVLNTRELSPIETISISCDGRYFVSGHQNGNIWIWKTSTGKKIRLLRGHEGLVNSVCFNPRIDEILSASWDHTIRIWKITGECIKILNGHEDIVRCASYNDSGTKIVSSSYDHTIRVWDGETGICLQSISTIGNNTGIVDFCTDGKHIISGTSFGYSNLWDFPPLKELIDETRERFKDNPLTPEERKKYYLE